MEEIHKGMNRIIPYPPNFRRTAARIIEPSKGASTWAFGSHKWVKYIGIFTRKANIIKMIRLNLVKFISLKMKELLYLDIIIVIKRGNEAVTV